MVWTFESKLDLVPSICTLDDIAPLNFLPKSTKRTLLSSLYTAANICFVISNCKKIKMTSNQAYYEDPVLLLIQSIDFIGFGMSEDSQGDPQLKYDI